MRLRFIKSLATKKSEDARSILRAASAHDERAGRGVGQVVMPVRRVTTPKNHQQRRVDMSPQLRAALRLWRRHQRAVWLKRGQPRPTWVFASTAGTPLDLSNVSKAFGLILDKAELHRRGLHQMRHTFASLLINAGEPVTYVSRQLGHRDSSLTLRVYAR
jgi:integrase